MESYLTENENIESTTTLRDYVRVFFRHKAVIVTCFLTVMITVFIGLKLKTPIYEARVKMLISAEKHVESPYYREIGYRNTEISLTQSEIVKSNPVIERAIMATKLYLRPLDYEKNFSSSLKSYLIDYNVKSQESKFAVFTDEQKQAMLFRIALENLKSNIKVEPIRDTNLFVISARDFDPLGSAIIANVVSRSYVIFDLEQQLAELTLKYGAKHPTVVQLRDSISSLKKNLSGRPMTDFEAIGPASVKIIEQAIVPLRPSGTSKLLTFILAFFMSIFLGVMLAFVFEYMDQTFKNPQDIERVLNLPFLGSVPRRRFGEELLIKKIKRKSSYNHHYQNLSDQLYLLIKDKNLKSILVTAAGSNEGTSSVIANLGIYFSQKAKQKVLLVDANLRKPSLHKIFKIKYAGKGLAGILEEKASLKNTIHKINPRLSILAAGKTELNPVILLDSFRFSDVINAKVVEQEITLIDCPDLRTVKDPIVLSSCVDAVVLIVNEGRTRRQVVKNAVASLQQRQVNILGVILNNRTYPIPGIIYKRV